jgi:hypothetical protein
MARSIRRPDGRYMDASNLNAALAAYDVEPKLKADIRADIAFRRSGRVEDGRGSLGPVANAPFPIPAHRTGRADLRHPALRLDSPRGTRRRRLAASVFCGRFSSFAFRHSSLGRVLSLMVFSGSSPITSTSPSSKAHQKSGSFAPPALPSIVAHTTLSDSRQSRRLSRR